MNESSIGGNTTVAPIPLGPSDALFAGLCTWTTSDRLCHATMLPIGSVILFLLGLLAYGCFRTPQSKVLEELIHPSKSLLLPDPFRYLSSKDLSGVLGGVQDLPLKTFLPRHDLGELVEPCAALGVASVRDMLCVNPLGLRDIGVGPKEMRIFSRALERKVKLREAMNDAFSLKTGASVSEKARQQLVEKRRKGGGAS